MWRQGQQLNERGGVCAQKSGVRYVKSINRANSLFETEDRPGLTCRVAGKLGGILANEEQTGSKKHTRGASPIANEMMPSRKKGTKGCFVFELENE